MSNKVEKNKWLYPTDEFGKFEKGVVDKIETDERIVIDLYDEIRLLPSEAKFTNKKPL